MRKPNRVSDNLGSLNSRLAKVVSAGRQLVVHMNPEGAEFNNTRRKSSISANLHVDTPLFLEANSDCHLKELATKPTI